MRKAKTLSLQVWKTGGHVTAHMREGLGVLAHSLHETLVSVSLCISVLLTGVVYVCLIKDCREQRV